MSSTKNLTITLMVVLLVNIAMAAVAYLALTDQKGELLNHIDTAHTILLILVGLDIGAFASLLIKIDN